MQSFLLFALGASLLFESVESIPTRQRHNINENHIMNSKGVKTTKAVYFQSNNPEGNAIIALKIGNNGNITSSTATETCGKGSAGVLDTGEMATVDALFSQGSVVTRENILLAVNAGSNTLSMFSIDNLDPTKLTLVGTPASTLGDFPNSVAYCPRLKRACVVNAGQKDGVTCYSVDPKAGLKCLDKAPRPLNMRQSTPPAGPAGTASHIFFAPDSKNLVLTVKGNPATNTTGFVGVFPVKNGCISQDIIRSNPVNTTVLFGSLMTSPTDIFATDAAFGIARLKLNPDGSVSTLSTANVDGQKATCWVSKSRSNGSVYVTDVGQPRIVEFDFKTGTQVGAPLVISNGQAGFIDTAVGGDFVYNLSPSANRTGVTILDVSGGKGNMKDMGTFWVPTEIAGVFSMGMSAHA